MSIEQPGLNPEEFNAPLEIDRPFEPIRVEKDRVIVMGVEIPRNAEPGIRTPNPKKFIDFQEDEASLPILQTIAKAVVLDEPLLLEGEAASGKSSSIEYLAMLTNQEVYRMSLNGQTDTTDLIGKWVPNNELWRKQVENILSHPEKSINPWTKEIIEAQRIKTTQESQEVAALQGNTAPVYFGFSKEEMMQIAHGEGIKIDESAWVWQDGELPRQIIDGAWTVLDEVNTCEPQILVRLNSILEKGGTLILHEDGSRIPQPKDPSKQHRMQQNLQVL